MRDEYEKQINHLLQVIKDHENKNIIMQTKNEALERNINELEMRVKDKEREIEMIKATQTHNFKYQEQLYKDSLVNSELIN